MYRSVRYKQSKLDALACPALELTTSTPTVYIHFRQSTLADAVTDSDCHSLILSE